METLYRIGIILAVIAIYVIATLGIAFIGTINEYDETLIIVLAYALGVIFFVGMTVCYLDKAGLWSLPNDIVVESETEMEVQNKDGDAL